MNALLGFVKKWSLPEDLREGWVQAAQHERRWRRREVTYEILCERFAKSEEGCLSSVQDYTRSNGKRLSSWNPQGYTTHFFAISRENLEYPFLLWILLKITHYRRHVQPHDSNWIFVAHFLCMVSFWRHNILLALKQNAYTTIISDNLAW